jgi:hypothetical protein
MRTGYVGVVKVEASGGRHRSPHPKPRNYPKEGEIAQRGNPGRWNHGNEIVRAWKPIMDIAEQMKVLSLNGSYSRKIAKGKAFKIVVAEMRKLAEKINEVLNAIHLSTEAGETGSTPLRTTRRRVLYPGTYPLFSFDLDNTLYPTTRARRRNYPPQR